MESRVANRQRVLLEHLRGGGPAQQECAGVACHPTSAGDSAAYERRSVSLDDVVIVSAVRTALCKAKRGGFKDTPVDDLVAAVLAETIRRTGVEPEAIGDVCFGSVMGPSSQRANEVRIAMFLAGFPASAIAEVAASIKAGYYTIGLAGGVESMTTNPMAWEGAVNPRVAENQCAQDCLLPMGLTSENVAAQFGVSREVQDAFAAASHAKAAAAQRAGKFRDEIVPVKTVLKDPKTGEERQVVIDADDGIRVGTTAASLGKLPSVFKKGGSTTAGNSSQVTDGAAAVLMMTRREALCRGLPILGIFRSYAAVGVPPAIMGIGPAVAIPEAVARAGLTLDDIDVFEINEAFASQATYSVQKLGIDADKARAAARPGSGAGRLPSRLPQVNPNGGAIALGHPLGCTGSRQTATLLHEMRRRGKGARFGVVSMCIGSGMGAAAVFEQGGEVDDYPIRLAGLNAGLSRDARV
eukprot:scaffold3.g6474.t1